MTGGCEHDEVSQTGHARLDIAMKVYSTLFVYVVRGHDMDAKGRTIVY